MNNGDRVSWVVAGDGGFRQYKGTVTGLTRGKSGKRVAQIRSMNELPDECIIHDRDTFYLNWIVPTEQLVQLGSGPV